MKVLLIITSNENKDWHFNYDNIQVLVTEKDRILNGSFTETVDAVIISGQIVGREREYISQYTKQRLIKKGDNENE